MTTAMKKKQKADYLCGTGRSANKLLDLLLERYAYSFQDRQVPLEERSVPLIGHIVRVFRCVMKIFY